MNIWILRALLISLLMASMTACASSGRTTGNASAGSTQTVTAEGALPPPDTTDYAGAYTGVSEYRIGPNDQLEISVFQVPELNRTVRVNTGGQISLPLVGVVLAGGRNTQELEAQLTTKLSETYLQNPQVSVFVKEFASQKVTLEGAFSQPGIYPLTGKTSLLQVIAMARGLTEMADENGIVVFRTVNGQRMAAAFRLKDIRSGKAEDPQIYGDDVVVVEQSGSKTALRRLMQSLPILNLFTAY